MIDIVEEFLHMFGRNCRTARARRLMFYWPTYVGLWRMAVKRVRRERAWRELLESIRGRPIIDQLNVVMAYADDWLAINPLRKTQPAVKE